MDDFVGFGLRLADAKASGEIDGHGFGDEARTGIKVKDAAPTGGGIAGFLEEFALSRWQRLFAGVDATGRDLPQKIVGGVAILALEEDAWSRSRFIDGENYDRAIVMNNVAASADAAGFLHIVRGHPKDTAAIDGARRNYFRFGVGILAGLSGL